jgi:hypothetical protein
MIRRITHHPFFIRLFNWEYWPFHVLYGPVYLYWLWLCIRARSFFFFNTSNPSIRNGGFLMESKWSIYKLMPEQYYPRTIFIGKDTNPYHVVRMMENGSYTYPVIAKPDIGMKGLAVKKINNEHELIDYSILSPVNFLVQEYIPYDNEVGIFYYRYPNETKGHISGIVSKEFLQVKGDGTSTVKELLMNDKRYILQLPVLKATYGKQLNNVLAEDETFVLVPYGNHVRGAKFIDHSHLISEELAATIDAICRQVDGFYYGRLDIRYNSWEELIQGKNFSIIEINGAGSEPTHMYDPKHSIFFAWKEITRHWTILARISRMNYNKQRQPYMDWRSGIKMLRESNSYLKLVNGCNK